jgi:F-type H+-transporting ATPase subunit a
MGNIAEQIQEEMQCEKIFEIPIFGGIPVYESVVVTWIIMAVIFLLCIILVRNLKVTNPGRKQVFLEFCVDWLYKFVGGMIGKEGERYVPYLISVLIYIGFSNIIGVFGFKSPTKDLNITIALAVMSIILIEGATLVKKRPKRFLKGFMEPTPIMLPFNILELGIRPLSLCMRLFGNVLGAFVVMTLIECVVPVVVPVAFSLYFDFFDGLIQAYVFVFLTSLFIKEGIED